MLALQEMPSSPYLAVVANILEEVSARLKEGIRLPAMAYLINSERVVVDQINATFSDNRSKSFFAETVRQRASRKKAAAVLFIAEAHGLPDKMSNPRDTAAVIEQYGSVAKCPFKVDCLVVSLETRDGAWRGSAELRVGGTPSVNNPWPREFGQIHWAQMKSRSSPFGPLLPAQLYGTDEFLAKLRDKLLQGGMDAEEIEDGDPPLLERLRALVAKLPPAALTAEWLDKVAAKLLQDWHDGA